VTSTSRLIPSYRCSTSWPTVHQPKSLLSATMGSSSIALFMGGETTPNRAVVQSAGYAYRLQGRLLKKEFNRAGELQHLLLRYTQALLTQMSQTAVCNRHHSVDQQLCRWLLLSLDRLPSNELRMTQELIANMLGVRREGVTEAAGKLQAAGVIDYGRGRISVIDRASFGNSLVRVLSGREDRIRPPPALQHQIVVRRFCRRQQGRQVDAASLLIAALIWGSTNTSKKSSVSINIASSTGTTNAPCPLRSLM